MGTWEYGELLSESVGVSNDGAWVMKNSTSWHDPTGDSRAVSGSTVTNLNALGAVGWELVGVTRNHMEELFKIKVVTTYHLKRPTS
jgi:hypothetical protein